MPLGAKGLLRLLAKPEYFANRFKDAMLPQPDTVSVGIPIDGEKMPTGDGRLA
jgi:hypothetical protein